MKKFFKKVSKSFHAGEKGFTLIELLIVIVILGILAAVAIPQVTKFIRNGKVSAANSELALMNTAMGSLMAEAQITTLTVGTSGPATITGLNAGLIASTPTDITITTTNPAGTYHLSDYIQGATINAIKGDYTFGANGVVASATYTGVNWNASNNGFN